MNADGSTPPVQGMSCPDCGLPLAGQVSACPRCALPLAGPVAVELWQVDSELSRLTARQAVLMGLRAELLGALRHQRAEAMAATAEPAAPGSVDARPGAEAAAGLGDGQDAGSMAGGSGAVPAAEHSGPGNFGGVPGAGVGTGAGAGTGAEVGVGAGVGVGQPEVSRRTAQNVLL